MIVNRLNEQDLLENEQKLLEHFASQIVASANKDDRDTALSLWEDERGHLAKLLMCDRTLGVLWGEYVVQWFKSFAHGGFEGIQRDAHFDNDNERPHPLQITHMFCKSYWEDPEDSPGSPIPKLPPIGMLLCDARRVPHGE